MSEPTLSLEKSNAAAVARLRKAVPDLVAVYRFGSSVAGPPGPDGDLDFAFLGSEPLPPVRRFDLQEELAAALRSAVDLVDLRRASAVMAMQVIGRGLLLFDGDPVERGRFEDLAYTTYARLNEERRGILERVSREGTVFGR